MRPLTSPLLGLCLSLSAMTSVGCAGVHRTVEYTGAGAADPRADAQIKEAFVKERASSLPPEAESVTVLIDTVPEGISLENSVLGVEDGYQHQILGKFHVAADDKFFFPAYKQGYLKGVCYWQQPLVIATLFIWLLVPTYYPCFIDGSTTKTELVDALKRVAYEAGGDLVIATYIGDNQDRAARAVGFVIKSDPRMRDEGEPSEDSTDPDDDETEEAEK